MLDTAVLGTIASLGPSDHRLDAPNLHTSLIFPIPRASPTKQCPRVTLQTPLECSE